VCFCAVAVPGGDFAENELRDGRKGRWSGRQGRKNRIRVSLHVKDDQENRLISPPETRQQHPLGRKEKWERPKLGWTDEATGAQCSLLRRREGKSKEEGCAPCWWSPDLDVGSY